MTWQRSNVITPNTQNQLEVFVYSLMLAFYFWGLHLYFKNHKRCLNLWLLSCWTHCVYIKLLFATDLFFCNNSKSNGKSCWLFCRGNQGWPTKILPCRTLLNRTCMSYHGAYGKVCNGTQDGLGQIVILDLYTWQKSISRDKLKLGEKEFVKHIYMYFISMSCNEMLQYENSFSCRVCWMEAGLRLPWACVVSVDNFSCFTLSHDVRNLDRQKLTSLPQIYQWQCYQADMAGQWTFDLVKMNIKKYGFRRHVSIFSQQQEDVFAR